jgi:hypothetical protein
MVRVPPVPLSSFVLTHYPHDPIEMQGGTTFTLTPTDRIRLRAIQGRLRRPAHLYCRRGIVYPAGDRGGRCRRGRPSSHPVILGSGERLIDGFEAGKPALELVRVLHAPGVAHLRYRGRPVTQWVIPRVNKDCHRRESPWVPND